MRFLADIGVAPRVVHWLREQGHDASHLSEESLWEAMKIRRFSRKQLERDRSC